jgi:cytochrome P450
MWNNNRIMRNYLRPYFNLKSSVQYQSGGSKTITDLAIQAYKKEVKESSLEGEIDPHFVEMSIAQMKIFIFAGHETTANTLCFLYHLISKHPDTLSKLLAEHDAVLGSDPRKAAENIAESPQLLNKLQYTSAVIKETLRLFPPVGTIRKGNSDFFLTHPETGVRYPTDGFMLFGCSVAEQHDEAYWPRPDDFVPERWMSPEGDPLHVRKNTWRPFELGPRNCIGQELAQIELRAILVLTLREFDVNSVYDENGPRILGDLAFQLMEPGKITGHPNGGMPVKVTMRNKKS